MDKMLAIAEDYFKGDGMVISLGTKHRFTKEETILISGRIEFNSYHHRRDAWDIFKTVANKPTTAVTEAAYKVIMAGGLTGSGC